ncbi:hypothetical protein Tco_1489043 [Tanacetum coccineum]
MSQIIIVVNAIPPDHVDDVPVVEPNQHDNVLNILEPVLVDEDEDPKEEEFKEEEEPQEEEDSEPEDVIEVEDTVEPEDAIVPASVHEVGNEVRSSVEEGTTAMENLVKKLGNAKEKAKCKKLKKELEEARGFMFEEILNEAIDVLVEDEKSPSSEPRGSPRDS